MKTVLLSLLLLFCLAANTQDRPMRVGSPEKRVALVIGNTAYPFPNQLYNPKNDAREMTAKLQNLGFEVVQGLDLSLLQIEAKVSDFYQKSQNADIAIIYYSGHGMEVKPDDMELHENFMIPVDAVLESLSDVPYKCYSISRLIGKLNDAKVKQSIVLLDACRTHSFDKGWRPYGGGGGLANITPQGNVFIGYATAAGEKAADGKGSHSPFANALLQHIATPCLSFGDIYTYVTGAVQDQTNSIQNPYFSGKLNRIIRLVECDVNPCKLDSDGDGFNDCEDKCKYEKGTAPDGCPPNPCLADADGDGFNDCNDKCKYEKGVAPDGCPKDLPEFVEMVKVQGGTFQMGSNEGDSDEKPVHAVTLSTYYIGRTEVTQKQWRDIMGASPSYFKNCDDCPVEQVSWEDIQEFLRKLNAKYPGKNYRLPTEVEWEFAARGGNNSSGYKYAGSNSESSIAWLSGNADSKTHPVGQKNANELGIYDMSGNVWEWCSDWKGEYSSAAQTNPTGASSGSYRVFRGGSWYSYAAFCRVAGRNYYSPEYRYDLLGFHLSRTY